MREATKENCFVPSIGWGISLNSVWTIWDVRSVCLPWSLVTCWSGWSFFGGESIELVEQLLVEGGCHRVPSLWLGNIQLMGLDPIGSSPRAQVSDPSVDWIPLGSSGFNWTRQRIGWMMVLC
ncbi:hypothetical protein PROFUN_16519 [Planoprotostelium fungivorum]|uniref:Uncharacterized protein n=1 Tax=Planoprotostelium fungivorum TaxID=1890364 RepID=A0A2P6MPL6_9EUKA|nr:hypothetical protein PROFUN_16519 [Planoprotostelium fungivorum]